MKTEGFRYTLSDLIGDHRYVVIITSPVDEVFHYTATAEDKTVEARATGVIRNKGDAVQLALAAVERHSAGLPRKGGSDSDPAPRQHPRWIRGVRRGEAVQRRSAIQVQAKRPQKLPIRAMPGMSCASQRL